MAFQFKRDRSQNLDLILAGDIDLEVTPEIRNQLVSQLEDANGLNIDGRNISYLDSSGVSILVISMQTCKQKQLSFRISGLSEEAFRVLELAKLNKILPIDEVTGPAQLLDVDAFSGVSGRDSDLAQDISADAPPSDEAADFASPSSDDDLIAELSKGDMGAAPEAEAAPAAPIEPKDAGVSLEMTPEPEPAPTPTPAPAPQPTATPAAPAPSPDDGSDDGGPSDGGGGFTPGTF